MTQIENMEATVILMREWVAKGETVHGEPAAEALQRLEVAITLTRKCMAVDEEKKACRNIVESAMTIKTCSL